MAGEQLTEVDHIFKYPRETQLKETKRCDKTV